MENSPIRKSDMKRTSKDMYRMLVIISTVSQYGGAKFYKEFNTLTEFAKYTFGFIYCAPTNDTDFGFVCYERLEDACAYHEEITCLDSIVYDNDNNPNFKVISRI